MGLLGDGALAAAGGEVSAAGAAVRALQSVCEEEYPAFRQGIPL